MKAVPVTGALGAVIEDVDLRDPNLDFDSLYEALLEHEVIFFREVDLSEEEHFALGRRFGTPSIFPVARILGATEPKMTMLADGPDSPNAADTWHTDVTWIATPPKVALLHMEQPSEVGGDTLWASATKAYDALSPAMQEFCCGLTAIHSYDGFARRVAEKATIGRDEILEALARDYPPVSHPLVRTHPETGKRALFLSRIFMSHFEQLTRAESDALMEFLDEHVKESALHCRWHWSKGDLAIWDERSTLHRAAADHWPQVRVIRRLEIDGDRPFFDPNR